MKKLFFFISALISIHSSCFAHSHETVIVNNHYYYPHHHDRVYVNDAWYHPDHVRVYYGAPMYYDGYPYYYYTPQYYYYYTPVDPGLEVNVNIQP